MDIQDREVFEIVNRNHEIAALAARLNAISAKRKRKKKRGWKR